MSSIYKLDNSGLIQKRVSENVANQGSEPRYESTYDSRNHSQSIGPVVNQSGVENQNQLLCESGANQSAQDILGGRMLDHFQRPAQCLNC